MNWLHVLYAFLCAAGGFALGYVVGRIEDARRR